MGETRCAIYTDELCGRPGGPHWACKGCWDKKLSPEAKRAYRLFFAKYHDELGRWLKAGEPKTDKPDVYFDAQALQAGRISAFPELGEAEKKEFGERVSSLEKRLKVRDAELEAKLETESLLRGELHQEEEARRHEVEEDPHRVAEEEEIQW